MKLLLFDIDGTLLHSGGAGKRAMNKTFTEIFGIQNAFKNISMAGMTDPGIIKKALDKHHLPWNPDKVELFKHRYFQQLRIEIEFPNPRKHIKPGIPELLAYLNKDPRFWLGLLTGNWQEGARIKLSHFGLNRYFKFGAFGDDSSDRNKLLPFALKRFEALNTHSIDLNNVYVIGDTPLDIQCAQPYGAKTIGIATGGHSLDELRQEAPDYVFSDLSDLHSFLEIFEDDGS
ncbi:hydrolase [candidate division KSB1 bacterium]|nr:MAG: hydrolase [candidate division KSB1 bacterium]